MNGLRNGCLVWIAAAIGLSACGTVPGGVFSRDGSPAGAYLAARFASVEQETSAAADFYAEALAADPDNVVLLNRTFLLAASAGDMRRALRLADRIVLDEPDSRAARLALAVAAMKKHDYPSAALQIRQSAEGPFTSLTTAMIEAWADAGQGNIDAGLVALRRLQFRNGMEALYDFHRALLLDFADRMQEADQAYRAALGTTGPSPRIVDAFGRFLERADRGAEALAIYARLARDNPDHPLMTAAQARIARGEKPDRLVRTAEDGAAEALFSVASSLSDERSADVAIFYLQLALHIRDDLDLARVLLADQLEAKDKYEAAIEVYKAIPSGSPYRDMVEIQIAVDEARLERKDAAIARLKALSERRPRSVEVWTALGDLLRGEERYAEAAAAYDKAVDAVGQPTERHWALLYTRGIAYERSQQWPEAERDLTAALELQPDQPQVLNYLGYSWVDQGRNLTEALAMLEKARALRPLDGYIVDSVGWAYFRLGKFENAAKVLEEAVLLVPGDPTINDHLGDAYWKVGRRIEARFQWGHALGLDPEKDRRPIIQRKLNLGLDAGAGGTS